MIHNETHPKAGQTVKVKPNVKHFQYPDFGGSDFRLEDWWDRVVGKSWMVSDGNPAAMVYAIRSAESGLPIDDNVVYGKVNHLGSLVHINELELE